MVKELQGSRCLEGGTGARSRDVGPDAAAARPTTREKSPSRSRNGDALAFLNLVRSPRRMRRLLVKDALPGIWTCSTTAPGAGSWQGQGQTGTLPLSRRTSTATAATRSPSATRLWDHRRAIRLLEPRRGPAGPRRRKRARVGNFGDDAPAEPAGLRLQGGDDGDTSDVRPARRAIR